MQTHTSRVFMIRPSRFGYNPQTADSNAFQRRIEADENEIAEMAVREFDRLVERLRMERIEVIVGDDKPEPHTPDAVFPNNWFSTHPDKKLVLYPMEAEARKSERDPDHIRKITEECGTAEVIDLSRYEAEGRFLEGTGSLVIDTGSDTAYACISSRTDRQLLDEWSDATGIRVVTFRAVDSSGLPIYHTNVIMCIGSGFAVVCLDSIAEDKERELVRDTLEASGHELIPINFDQMSAFAGNMLQLQRPEGTKLLVMSETALRSLEGNKLEQIKAHTDILSFDIPTIEACGGGSVRCMIAELF